MPINNSKVDGYARQLASQAIESASNSSTTFVSSGTSIKPTITYNTGLGTVTIGQGTYRMYHTPDYTGIITEHTIPETTLSIAENITSYICADYNNGSPILRIITDSSQFNWSNIIAGYTCTRDGDYFSYVDWDSPGNGLSNKIHDRLIKTNRFARQSGLNLGEEANRTVIISSGTVWQGVYKNSMEEVNSSVDICRLAYTLGDGTFALTNTTQYNNTQYNTNTGLATLTEGNYAVNWIFRMIGNQKEFVIFLGNEDYDLNSVKTSQLPNNIPASFYTNGMLIGRIIVQKDAVAATQIDSAFDTIFAASAVTSHDGLVGLIGGGSGLYYHSDQPINTTNDVEFNSIKSSTLIKDSTNTAKNAQFNTSAITSGTTRVYDLPDKNGTIAVGIDNVTNDTQVKRTEMGVADGVATLDNSGKLTTSQIPDAILGGLNFQSLWDANTNTPAIPVASTLNKGYYYKVNVAGTTLIDGISDWTIGDWIVSNGTIWDKVDAYEAVTSVSGKTGDVTLVKGDVGLGNVTNDAQVKKIANNVNGNIVTWSGTNGDTVTDSGKSLPSGSIVGTTDAQTLSNKTFSTADGTNGYVTMNTDGSPIRTGFFEWRKGDGTRLGFMGDGETDINFALENGAKFVVNGYTKLGNDAPAIKQKKIEGTTPSTVLTLGNYPHGLTKSKILGYQMIVESGADNILIPPNNGDHPTDLHYYFTYIDNINLTIYPGSSATTILGKPFRAIITYEE